MITTPSIIDILTEAGAERLRGGKWKCPNCHTDKVSVSTAKGIAKCWHSECGAFWSVSGLGDACPRTQDWATYLISEIAERSRNHLAHSTSALDWLTDVRGLPRDIAWLQAQDLGAFPVTLNLSAILDTAKVIRSTDAARREDRAKTLEAQAKGLAKKEAAIIEAKAAIIRSAILTDEMEFDSFCATLTGIAQNHLLRDAVTYIYRDAAGYPCSINIRQHSTEPEQRTVRRLQPRASKRGLFGLSQSNIIVQGADWDGADLDIELPILTVVEGEHNLLTLRAWMHTLACSNWDFAVPAVAVGGKNGADIDCIHDLVGEDEPLVVYDNDKSDPNTGLPGGYDLVSAIAEQMYARATTTPTKDLDDYITEHPDLAPETLWNDIYLPARRVLMSYAPIRRKVERLLSDKSIEANAKEIAVSDTIIADLKRRANIYKVDGYALIVMQDTAETTDQIPAREGDPKFYGLLLHYGIAQGRWRDVVGCALGHLITTSEVLARPLHSIAYYDGSRLYLNCGDGSMIQISVEGSKPQLRRVPVGVGDVLMHRYARSLDDREARIQPWYRTDMRLDNILPGSMRHREDSLMDAHILANPIYKTDPERCKQLLKCWFLSTFFSSQHKSKPVPVFEGPPGAGKTSVGVAIGNLLMGENFTASNCPRDSKSLADMMTGVPFLVLDDWDSMSPDVETEFKLLTTGGTHTRRELYTTSQTVTLRCDAAVMATTNADPTRQASTSRRQLLIQVAPRQTAPGVAAYQSVGRYLLPRLMTARPKIWVELIADLAACVVALSETPDDTRTSFSMSDFGVFTQSIANYEGWGQQASDMLAAAEQKQEQQAMSKQVLLDQLLPELMSQQPGLWGKYFSARDWADHLQSIIPSHDSDLKKKINIGYIAYVLKSFEELYKRHYGMTTRRDGHTKIMTYAFSRPANFSKSEIIEEEAA